ncbi:MAG: VOC family protein [Thermoleophilia bacterium]
MLRFDHVGVIVEDLDAASAFFRSLGFERQGAMTLEDDVVVDRINGLDGVRVRMEFVRTPDGTGSLELIQYLSPVDGEAASPAPPNRPGMRHICIEVDDIDGLVARLRGDGFDTVGDVQDYGDMYRLCYLRGPEGLIVEFAEKLGARTPG